MTTITIKTIAKQLKLNPKIARRKLRNSKNVPKTVKPSSWEWAPKHVSAIKKLLAA